MRSLFSRTRKLAISLFAAALAFSMVPTAAMAEDTAPEEADAPVTSLFDTFEGAYSDYDFEEAKTILFNMQYKYSSTGGLAGVDALSPATVKALAVPQDDGTYECEFSLKSKEAEGFRMTLDATPLNEYLVNPPQGDETQEELHAMLQNGDFAGDVKNKTIYYYQEKAGKTDAAPDYEATNPAYENRYSTEYNEAWNAARTLVVDGDDGFSAAIVSRDTDKHVGANALPNPKLVVKLTEAQLEDAAANGRDITVNYRRNATWYTVNHWVPQDLSGLEDFTDMETKTEGDVDYVLLDSGLMQGRVGALTRAAAKTDGTYETLVSESFQQKLVDPSDTVVDIYYKAADLYRVIFDTDYGYFPRQNATIDGSVSLPANAPTTSEGTTPEDVEGSEDTGTASEDTTLGDTEASEGMEAPVRKGYRFAGWQYLKKGAVKNEDGSYPDSSYALIGDEHTASLTLTSELISKKAKIVTTENVKTLSLYPKWEPGETQVTVVLWTENLNGQDVQAKAKGGDASYYNAKYADYRDEIAPMKPSLDGGNAETYSNVGSFTVDDVKTDSSLLGGDATKLKHEIQERVNAKFADAVKDSKGRSASEYYTQDSFEIMHATNGTLDKSPTTANADGETAIYVYFTRNIYTLEFNYYGYEDKVDKTNARICNNTNGFSYAPDEDIAKFRKDGLDFSYSKSNQKGDTTAHEPNSYVNVAGTMTVPQTITIRAKYGADLRNVWPSARPEENLKTSGESSMHAVSWATTAGDYNDAARGSKNPEPTIIGLYATMDEGIIASPAKPDTVHQLAMYWYPSDQLSYYRFNHCFELPKFDVNDAEGVREVVLHNDPANPDALQNKLYLVPTSTPAIAKYDFSDLLKVSYDEGTKSINYGDPHGTYYAVRGYVKDGTTKYYAVGRRVTTPSSNSIDAQKPSARAHMQRVNKDDIADHTTQYADTDGRTWGHDPKKVGFIEDTETISPCDIYFYYDRNLYTITYMSSSQRHDVATGDVELGRIELPFGAHVTNEYAFKLDMRDTNKAAKYRWHYPTDDSGKMKPAVPVCPDRASDGNAPWVFKGWGLGPAGVNMQWSMPEEDASVPQALEADDFYISSDMLLYAIWKAPMLKVTFHLNGGVLIDRTADTLVTESIPANTKITDTTTFIPRPVRSGHTMTGWFKGTIGPSGEAEISGNLFDFDEPITEDQHVFATWISTTDKRFSYTVYHVAPALAAGDTASHETIQLDDDGNIVSSGGTTYYVLAKDVKTDQVYTEHMTVNLTVTAQPGYVPRDTNKALTPSETGPNNVAFIYDAHTPSIFEMNFVEAGTEKTASPASVKTVTVEADQAVMTPDKATAEELMAAGYRLVNRNDDESYEPVSDSHDLTWLDEDGDVCSIKEMNDRVIHDDAPRSVRYLVQPIPYVIAYENAESSPDEAGTALTGVTSDDGTPVEAALAAGKNPTQYTVKDRFMLKNPGRVQAADGTWYAFSHWTLGDGTTSRTEASADDAVMSTSSRAAGEAAKTAYATIRINPGTLGSLKFIANWVEVPENDPVAAPDDPEDPADPADSADPARPSESASSDDPIVPKKLTSLPTSLRQYKTSSLAQTGDDSGLACVMLAALSGLAAIALSIQRLRKD